MSREFFELYHPQKKSRRLIRHAIDIVDEYIAEGIQLTLRQLYYQFVARDLIPNTEKSYNRLGGLISKARLGGYLPWDAITDRGRHPTIWAEWGSIDACVEQAIRRFRLPRLDGQDTYVEVWVEKDALASVLEPVASQYHVPLQVNRGYSSSSSMKEAADRIRDRCERYGSEQAAVLYLGDMDPSGEDMVRDIRERLDLFTNGGRLIDEDGEPETLTDMFDRKPPLRVTVEKVALTMAQVKHYKPPPNPAKLTDSRAKEFIKKYGRSSWELDAIPPTELRRLITEAIEKHIDMELMQDQIDLEDELEKKLRKAMKTMKGKGKR